MVKKIKILTLALLSTLLTSAQCENDTINPWFVNFQFEPTIECDDNLLDVFPQVYDNCDSTVDVIWYEEVTYGDCPSVLNITRYNRTFDDGGNQVVETQVIHIVDETPPTIIGEQYLEIPDSTNLITTSFATAVDNCSSVTFTYTDVEVSGNNVIRLYMAIDECGNISTFEQILHLYQTPPDKDEDEDEDDEDNEDEDENDDDEDDDEDEDDENEDDDDDEDEDDDCEDDEDNDNDRVAICHRLGNGGWITIYVAQQAVPAHLNHGDYLGPCNEIDQILPYTLEKLPNGEVKKYKRCK